MLNWNYNSNDYDANKTGKSNLLPEGKYRVKIINATETTAKNGTEGLEITFEVKGHNGRLRHYIWYNRENAAHTNQLLGEFFDSFDIREEDRNTCAFWWFKTGAVYVVHDEYKGRTIAKVAFCLRRNQQDGLPAWEDEPSASENDLSTKEDVKISSNNPKMSAPRAFGTLVF